MMHTLECLHHLFLKNLNFDVDDGATKAKIKSAFVKSLKTKKLNKKVLGEFISWYVESKHIVIGGH